MNIFSLSSGKSESYANLAEGLATALVCFDDMNELRDEKRYPVQNHCVLICNSAPYLFPVMENVLYENKTVEQMAVLFQEVRTNFCSTLSFNYISLHMFFFSSIEKCESLHSVTAQNTGADQNLRES